MPALAALAALALAADVAADPAAQEAPAVSAPSPQEAPPFAAPPPKYGPNRFRLLPPYTDPGFLKGPVPPPDKNYGVALAEVVLIDTSIWAFNYLRGKEFAKISWDSIEQNFDKGWIIDTDDFWANGLGHPLHGNLTFNAARTLGLNFYESFAYSFFGSFLWEQFAEIQPPSMNDQVNTPFGGTMVGESLFRLSRLILDAGGYKPSVWREFFAFLFNPMGGLNRLFYGDKYRGELLLPASWIGQFRFGTVIAGSSRSDRADSRATDIGPWASFGAYIVYGVPGTPGLSLSKPFDHFEASASISLTSDVTTKPTATLIARGLLLGEQLGPGGESGGLWGLFTSYDFIAPNVFRVQGFGLGPGVSLMKQWGWFELHGTGVLELLPWAGGGSTVPLGVRDYHYGPGGEALLQFRAHFSDRVIVRLEGRQYFVTGAYARGGSEAVSYGKLETTVRVQDVHGIAATLDWGHRQASYFGEPDIWQRASVFSLYYTLIQGW